MIDHHTIFITFNLYLHKNHIFMKYQGLYRVSFLLFSIVAVYRKDDRALQKLRREVEKAKRTLSYRHETRIEIEALFNGEDFSQTLTRAKFEEINLVGI